MTADCNVGQISIDKLPDEALLEIFYFFVEVTIQKKRWRSGSHWRRYVGGGEGLSLDHHVASIYDSFAQATHPRGTRWMYGQPCFSSLKTAAEPQVPNKRRGQHHGRTQANRSCA